jgi:hypothetical protein
MSPFVSDTNDTDLTLYDTPPPKGSTARARDTKFQTILAHLKEHPGRWIRIVDTRRSTQYRSFRAQGCLTTTRRQDDGTVELWVSYPEPGERS